MGVQFLLDYYPYINLLLLNELRDVPLRNGMAFGQMLGFDTNLSLFEPSFYIADEFFTPRVREEHSRLQLY